MLWITLGLAAPPTLQPAHLSWLPGLWGSTAPEKRAHPTPLDGARLVVKDGIRHTGRRQTTVFQIMQLRHKHENGPSMLQEEIWFEPTGTFLQVWLGTGGGPVRLLPDTVTADRVVFGGQAGTFPSRIEFVREGEDIVVVHEGTYKGQPVRMEWHYETMAPPVWDHQKKPATP